jgi:hypothetical protein
VVEDVLFLLLEWFIKLGKKRNGGAVLILKIEFDFGFKTLILDDFLLQVHLKLTDVNLKTKVKLLIISA